MQKTKTEQELEGHRAALLTIANGEQALDEHTEQPENWWPSAAACAKAALLAGERIRDAKVENPPGIKLSAAALKWRGAMDALGATSQDAARGYTEAIDRCAGDALQAAGLWDGRAETKEASARAAAGRLRIDTYSYADRPTETLITLDGLPVGKVRWEVVSCEYEVKP